MSKQPPIPPEQRSVTGGDEPELRDAKAPHDSAAERSGVNPDQQGQTANTRQNTTPHLSTQDR